MDSGDSTRFTFWFSSGVRVPHRVPILIMNAHIKAIIKCKNNKEFPFDSVVVIKEDDLSSIKNKIAENAGVSNACEVSNVEVQYLFAGI